MAKQAWLQFGTGNEPRQTIGVPLRETETPRKGQTQTGYGPALPTPYLVKWEGRWRRVYAACYGNAASHYLGKPGNWLCTVDITCPVTELEPGFVTGLK